MSMSGRSSQIGAIHATATTSITGDQKDRPSQTQFVAAPAATRYRRA